MINENESNTQNEKKSHIYDIDRPRTRHWHKYPKYKMSHYNDGYMY